MLSIHIKHCYVMKLLDLEKGSDLVCSNVWDIKTENQNINISVPRLLSAGQCIKSSNEDECFLVSLPVFSMRQSLSHSVSDGPIYWWRTPPAHCLHVGSHDEPIMRTWPPTPASARGHTQDGNQHGTENIFLFSGSPLNCVSDTDPSDCEASE